MIPAQNPQKKHTNQKSHKLYCKLLTKPKFSQLISTTLLSPMPQDPTTTFALLAQDRQVNCSQKVTSLWETNFAGIHMALSLKDRGFSDVVIFERYAPYDNSELKPFKGRVMSVGRPWTLCWRAFHIRWGQSGWTGVGPVISNWQIGYY